MPGNFEDLKAKLIPESQSNSELKTKLMDLELQLQQELLNGCSCYQTRPRHEIVDAIKQEIAALRAS